MTTFFLICFVLGLTLSLLAAFGGLGRLHFGHFHVHGHAGVHAHGASHVRSPGGAISAINGFTLPAFLGWFGGAGYLLYNYSPLVISAVLLLAIASGLIGAGFIYVILFKLLLPRERVLSPEDTRMDGVVGRVSDEIRANGIGEILFSQLGALRGSPARSESGEPIPRGTEVVVLRYAKGIAYVSPLDELTTWDRSQQ